MDSKIESKKEKKRVFYLDVLRVVACVAVVLVHCSSQYVKTDIGSFDFWIGNVIDSLARIGVPLFVMISGTLLLDKNYCFGKKKLISHVKRLVFFFLFWSAVYCLSFRGASLIKHPDASTILEAVGAFIQGHYHLWFIYLIIGLYLITPLLRLWVKDENKKYVKYFIGLAVVFAFIVPQIIDIGSYYSDVFAIFEKILRKKLYLEYVGGFTAYFILGWYINNFQISKQMRNTIYALGFVGLFTSVIGTFVLSFSTGEVIQMYDYLWINVLLQTVAVFVYVKTRVEKNKQKSVIVTNISNRSLGIYAMHVAVVVLMQFVLRKIGLESALVDIPIVFAVSFGVSYIGTAVFSKIPFLKQFV